jgi:hypothetical protein
MRGEFDEVDEVDDMRFSCRPRATIFIPPRCAGETKGSHLERDHHARRHLVGAADHPH